MGTKHKFHTRKVLPKAAIVAWEHKDEYFYAAEQAAARAKSYKSAIVVENQLKAQKRKEEFTCVVAAFVNFDLMVLYETRL